MTCETTLEGGTMDATGGVWMSAGEVAGRLGLPVRTVLDLARRGALPAVRQPIGAPRFCWSQVEASFLVAGDR